MANVRLMHSFEKFEAINEAKTDEAREQLLKQYGNDSPLNYLLSMNFNQKIKVDLPEGMPDTLNLDTRVHPDLMHPLATQINRMRNCFVDARIPKFKKEKIFLDIIECIPIKEVYVLVACKDKALEELYPNITKELVQKVFPNFIG